MDQSDLDAKDPDPLLVDDIDSQWRDRSEAASLILQKAANETDRLTLYGVKVRKFYAVPVWAASSIVDVEVKMRHEYSSIIRKARKL